jgi:hypothetical protein
MDMVSARFAQSLTTLKKVGQCTVTFLIGSLIYDSRNKLASMAVELEADYMLWFDSDMVFDASTLERMMKVLDEHPDIDILSGLYFRRGTPFTPVLFSKLEVNDKGELEFEDYANIYFFILSSDEESHKERFVKRAVQIHRGGKQLDFFRENRIIHDHLLKQAQEYDVNIINTESIDKTLEKILSVINKSCTTAKDLLFS